MRKFYRDNNNSNDGYILFIDFSKYYDNILHKKLYEDVTDVVDDEYISWLYYQIIRSSRIDVSSLSDVEIEYYKNNTINLLEYNRKGYSRTGKKYINKSLDIGEQTSQISGNYYAHMIDNKMKIVNGCKYYGRYCDDIYIMSSSKERLKELLNDVFMVASEYGIKINRDKTKIVKMSSTYKFLQIRYNLTDTGKVVKLIDRTKITKMRRKLRKLKVKLEAGEVEYKSIESMFKSWFGTYKKYMTKKQKCKMCNYYNELFTNDWRYKNVRCIS